MILMNDLLNIYRKNGSRDEYKLLCIIKRDYNYVLYTNFNNTYVKENIYVAKTKNASYLEEILPMDENDWNIVEEEYIKLLNN